MPDKLRREDDIDSAYDFNRGEKELRDAERATGGSYADAGADQAEAFANDPTNASRETAQSGETDTSDGAGGWTVNRSNSSQSSASRASTTVKVLKKTGPAGVLLGFLLAAAGLVSFFGGPGLLIVNIAEKMTEKFNYQLASMDTRTTKILVAKTKNTTTGVCTPVKVKCKFASFSKKEIDNFKRAGIEIVPDENASKTLGGRTKAKSFKYNGREISAADFGKTLKTDHVFARAVLGGYNPKFAGMSDAVSAKVFAKLKVSKANSLPDDLESDEERMKAVQEQTKNGQPGAASKHVVGELKNPECSDGDKCERYSQADIDAETKAGVIGDAASQTESDGTKSSTKALNEISNGSFKLAAKATNLVKITGIADDACSVYGLSKAVSIAAKTIRKAQMVRFAMIFLTHASMIKAGDGTVNNSSFLGNTLTKTMNFTDSDGVKKTSLAATDSFGYRYAAFGDKGINTKASPFLAGGGLAGELSGVTNIITSIIGGPKAADKTCKTLRNPFVQAGSFLAGVALMIIPGAQAISGPKILLQMSLAAFTFAAEMLLPALIADIIAGNLIDENTSGEDAGNAIAAGSGALMSDLAITGGNAPLTKSQAKDLVAVNQEVRQSYAEMDRLATSPFDATNPNTFLGSIAGGLMPYIHSGDQTLFGKLSGFASISTSALRNFVSTPTYAETTESFDECTDPEYEAIDLATDPFCNPVSGIPSASMDDDPNAIIDRLLAAGQIDETSGQPIDEYEKFVNDCIERDTPFGSTGQDSTTSDGSDCFIGPNDQRKGDYYVHYVDMRVNDGMENGLNNGSTGSAATGSQVATGGYALPVDQKFFDSNPEWFSKPHHDYAAADIPVPMNTKLYAMTGGKVTMAPNGTVSTGYGLGVTILGDDGVTYNYGHGVDGGQVVKIGDTVTAGQLIMHSGTTGNSTGPHLHIDMRINKIKHCPQNLLVALGKGTAPPLPSSLPTSGCSN